MGREIKRLPVDFDWPLREVWSGYLMPDKFAESSCPDCEIGYSPRGQYLHDLWYGKVPFDPESTGSMRLSPYTPAVWAFAERNVTRAPEYYGTGDRAIDREARRLADMWNGMWSHHLSQQDVQALIDGNRLRDFTHTFTRGEGWEKIEPAVVPTAAQVNEWSLQGLGHDSINEGIVVRARCEREGVEVTCSTCGGHGSLEAYPGQRAEADAWERKEPPTGPGWQLWETVSEGSPVTPVFAEREGLVAYLCSDAYEPRLTRDEAEGLVSAGWVPSGIGVRGRGFLSGDKSQGEFARIVLELPERDE